MCLEEEGYGKLGLGVCILRDPAAVQCLEQLLSVDLY